MSEFDSCWWKWQRAGVHMNELQGTLPIPGQFTPDTQPFLDRAIETEYDAKRHCVTFRWGEMRPMPTVWATILGDIVHNFSSALDHLAWVLVHRGKYAGNFNKGEENGIYFPYSDTREHFNAELDRGLKTSGRARLPGIRVADSARIRRRQPYQAGKRKIALHPLTILSECSNRDKHRELKPLWIQPPRFAFSISQHPDCEITRNALPRTFIERIEPKAEIGRVYVRRTGPNPDVKLNGAFAGEVAIKEGVAIQDWMHQTQRSIGALLAEFADPPLGVLYLPEGWDVEWGAPT
jgi:hypothetical protein